MTNIEYFTSTATTLDVIVNGKNIADCAPDLIARAQNDYGDRYSKAYDPRLIKLAQERDFSREALLQWNHPEFSVYAFDQDTGKLVGMGQFTHKKMVETDQDKSGFLYGVYTDPDYRGKFKIGSTIVEMIIKHAEYFGVKKLFTHSAKFKKRLQRDHGGFRNTGKTYKVFVEEGLPTLEFDIFEMGLPRAKE